MNAKNMKRESKAYSYKEQQEEIMLRKEIEAKKIKEGKLKKPELSVKQKEAMAIELEKETNIRNKLKNVCIYNFYHLLYIYYYFINLSSFPLSYTIKDNFSNHLSNVLILPC